jgi:hypothetical protein
MDEMDERVGPKKSSTTRHYVSPVNLTINTNVQQKSKESFLSIPIALERQARTEAYIIF